MPVRPPSITVIMVCRNPGDALRGAVESVWAQGSPPELVVIDGASTDGSREWLENRRARLSAFLSEPDTGVYDAMNKGVDRATGDWVLFLGADDRIAGPDTLADVSRALASIDAEVAVGEARFDDGRRYAFAGTRAAIRRNFAHHQATLYRREVFERHGRFDVALRIQGDYELNLRLLRAGSRFASIPVLVSQCASGGLSDAGRWPNYREEITVRRRHFPLARCWPWDAGSMVRFIRKRVVRRLG